jgi:hypothetical protein
MQKIQTETLLVTRWPSRQGWVVLTVAVLLVVEAPEAVDVLEADVVEAVVVVAAVDSVVEDVSAFVVGLGLGSEVVVEVAAVVGTVVVVDAALVTPADAAANIDQYTRPHAGDYTKVDHLPFAASHCVLDAV